MSCPFCRMLEEFADEILRESASRANRKKTPLSYRQLRERWRDATDKKRTSSATPAGSAPKQPANSGNSSGGGAAQQAKQNKPAGGRRGAGAQTRGTAAKFGGNPVCFMFNSRKTGCPRTAKQGGCDDGRGGIYAHVCNFETGPGQHCLAVHPRHANH